MISHPSKEGMERNRELVKKNTNCLGAFTRYVSLSHRLRLRLRSRSYRVAVNYWGQGLRTFIPSLGENITKCSVLQGGVFVFVEGCNGDMGNASFANDEDKMLEHVFVNK